MNKSVKNLLRISSVFYKWTNASMYTCPIHCVRDGHVARDAPVFDVQKGITKGDNFNLTNNSDSLLNDLKTFGNVEHILCAIKANSDKINKQHVLAAMTSLYNISRTDSYINLNLHSKEFTLLLKILYTNIRLMDVDEAVTVLKIINHLTKRKDADKSLIIQSLLQIIRSSVNDLSLENIFSLSKIIEQFKPTPLSEALKVALPIIFDIRLSRELDRSNEHILVKALEFATTYNCNSTTVMTILEALPGVMENLDAKQASSVYLSLTFLQNVKEYEDLFKQILDQTLTILNTKGDKMPKRKIPFIMRRITLLETAMSLRTNEPRKYFSVYDEELMDNLIKWLLSEGISLHQLYLIMYNLNKMRHVNFQILDFAADKFDELNRDTAATDLCDRFAQEILSGIVIADYRPKPWDNIRMKVIDCIIRHTLVNQHINFLLHHAIYLASIDYYNPKLLNIIFTTKYEGQPSLALLHMYQYVKTFYPEYTGPFPSDEILQKSIENRPHISSPLKGALEQGFGDPRYVQHNLRTKLGQVIDHAVAMRKGGYPIAISSRNGADGSTPIDIESLVVPSDSQIILILNLPREAYPKNCNRLRGTWVQHIKCLEAATGYNVVAINTAQWEKLHSFEKISYLMQAIRFRCVDVSWDMHCR